MLLVLLKALSADQISNNLSIDVDGNREGERLRWDLKWVTITI